MPVPISAPLIAHSRIAPVQPEQVTDLPPTLQFVIEFFNGYKAKIFLVGVAAILAGLGLVVVDLLTAGVVAPFTSQLTVGLFSFGAAAIGISVTAKFLSGDQSGDANSKEGSDVQKKLIRPRGRRCNRAYQSRRLHRTKVALIQTETAGQKSVSQRRVAT